MAKFITRIELHEADSSDYDTLHEEMKNEGFDKTINGDDNKAYHLPNGEYYFNQLIEIHPIKKDYQIVLDKAISASKKTKKKFSVITCRADAFNWYQLDPID